jgi:hypothetical protein
MRKLHWVSLALIAAPLVLMHACGGDDTTPAPASGTAGSGGSGGSGGSATGGGGNGGSATGGSATGGGGNGGSATGGSAGKGGSAGSGGSATDGGGGTTSSEGGDAAKSDAISDAASTSDANATCGDDASPGNGQSCKDYCTLFLAICNSNTKVTDSGSFYSSNGDCMSKCNALSQTALCCRAYHVNNANGDAADAKDTHCPHAAGLSLCM